MYETDRLIKILLPDTIDPPGLTLCLRFNEIINWKQYLIDFPMSQVDDDYLDSNLTIKEYFKYSPEPLDLLVDCSVRRSFVMEHLTGSQCRSQLEITKRYVQRYLCYLFRWIEPTVFRYQDASRAMTHINAMYYLNLDTVLLQRVTKFKAILHYGRLPDTAADLAPPITRVIDDVTNRTSNSFAIDYYYVKTKRLALPYDSKCLNYTAINANYEDQYEAIDACTINKTLEASDKVPFTTMICFPYDKLHISETDLRNNSLMNVVRKVEDICETTLSRVDCEDTYLSCDTTVSIAPKFRITATVPQSPCFDVEYTEVLSLTEYIAFISSCLNIWYGLSVIGSDPLPIVVSLRTWMKSDRKKIER
ncbi:hypothetical protein HDE_11062 [Halotydeus destructor]|nr:hypothetical protein HDE_11062 [Halotydeus destructor]